MANKTTNLSVHRNTVERRAKRQLGSYFRKNIERVFKTTDVRMYAFVSIDADGAAHAAWDTGGIIPLWAAPAMIAEILKKDMAEVEEDWKPPLRTVTRNIKDITE